MKENRYLTEAEWAECYDIHSEFMQMLVRYKDYLNILSKSLINQKIDLYTTNIGVLALSVKEKNKKGITTITIFDYIFIK